MGLIRALRTFLTSSFRSDFSSCFFNSGLPNGCGMATVGTILLAPTVLDMGTMEQAWTTGSPAFSISLTIVAPQRVHVPQVEVRRTASTPAADNSRAMACPNFLALATEVALPTVA